MELAEAELFDRRKAAMLASLSSSLTDKSPKGTLDSAIVPLIHTLNSHPSFYTTSSCSGRISVLSSPLTNTNTTNKDKNKKKARGGTWLYVSHSPALPDHVVSVLFKPTNSQTANELVFRFEPFILAVECRNVEWAQKLVSLAIRSGFRESGITSIGKNRGRVIVGIRCSIRMEVPLGEEGKVFVGEDYVRFLVDVANGKMEDNRRRYEGFFRALKEDLFAGCVKEDGDGAVLGNEAAGDEDGLNGQSFHL